MGRDRQYQPEFGLPHEQGGYPSDDEKAQRAYHQYLLGGRSDRQSGQTNYAAAKAGMVGFGQIAGARNRLARSHREYGGAGFYRYRHDARIAAKNSAKRWPAQIPLGRLGSPEEVAAAVVFLASPAAAYITGETIHVNGGMYMP